jgi:RNA polymerase sigma-70 factor (ECF subfamily)
MQLLNDRNAAEDIVQDFFVNLWFDSPKIQIKNSLKAYLFASIRNRSLDYLKHQKVTKKFQANALFTPIEDNSFEHYLVENELCQIIERSLEKLTPRCREIFEMNRIKGLSNQEISERLGISKRTVELQITNSLKILRKELVEYLPLYILPFLLN